MVHRISAVNFTAGSIVALLLGQLVQIIGAVLILTAFLLLQLRIIASTAYSYLWLNLVGSCLLAYNAYVNRQPGFILLEGIWTLASIASLIGTLVERNKLRLTK